MEFLSTLFGNLIRQELPQAETNIVFCIPMSCQSLLELTEQKATSSGDEFEIVKSNSVDEAVLIYAATSTENRIEFNGHNQKVADTIDTPLLIGATQSEREAIRGHKSVVHLICPGGSVEKAKEAVHAAMAILGCGGCALKVETSGKLQSVSSWKDIAAQEKPDLIDTFVLHTIGGAEDGLFYSCGMHNFGMRDVAIVSDTDELMPETVEAFLYMLYVDQPEILAGQTFSKSADAERYVISDSFPQPCAGIDVFENPHGVWQLKRDANSKAVRLN